MQFKHLNETTANGRIEVSKLGSGWAAIHVVDVYVGDEFRYCDIHQTGMDRYQTRLEAVYEARDWAAAEGIPFNEE